MVLLAVMAPAGRSADQPAAPVPDITGRWHGVWLDAGTGHRGPLHARVRRLDACRYHATFHGRFAKVIPFATGVDLTVVGQDGEWLLLAGTHRSALTGRVYEYTARVNACEFVTCFTSDRYHGEFRLTRTR